MDTLAVMQTEVNANRDSETVESYSSLLRGVMKTVETINKIHLQKEKIKSTKEIKQMDIDSKEKIAGESVQSNETKQLGGNTTNNMILTREEFFKFVTDGPENEEIIDVEVEDTTPG